MLCDLAPALWKGPPQPSNFTPDEKKFFYEIVSLLVFTFLKEIIKDLIFMKLVK